MDYNGTPYYYAANLQGDTVAILDGNGTPVVTYTYDAWGKLLSVDGSLKDTLGALNPLTYRGYVYDTETEFYYLQSRYYNPTVSRFLNADAFASTGQGLLGNNMFAYCNNNPVNFFDPAGNLAVYMLEEPLVELGKQIGKWIYDTFKDRKEEIEKSKKEDSEVRFEPNTEGGGVIFNSYMITDWDEIYEYSSKLKEEYPSNFKGSVEGIAVEWVVHNAACYIPLLELGKAKDVNLGATIFDDTHTGLNLVMWFAYYMTHPYQWRSDLWIHFE